MKPILLVVALALVNATDLRAETLSAVAVQGDALSSLYGVSDIDEAETESVAVANDIVTIRGSADFGRRACRYTLRFDGGVLSRQLEALGCEAEQ